MTRIEYAATRRHFTNEELRRETRRSGLRQELTFAAWLAFTLWALFGIVVAIWR